MTKAHIFRQVALDRLSSPDRLDELLEVTKSRSWLALVALLLVMGAAAAWAFEGSIATTVQGRGLVLRRGGVLPVVANSSGILMDVKVRVGDRVQANQVIASVAQPELVEQIKAAREGLAMAKRSRDRVLISKQSGSTAEIEAVEQKRNSIHRSIRVLTDQVALAAERVTAAEHLLTKGLITRQQALTAREKKLSLEGDIENARAELKRLDAQEVNQRLLPTQADIDTQSQVADAERRLGILEGELRVASRVVSTHAGEVLEVMRDTGAAVTPGMSVISVQPSVNEIELLLYVNALQAKDVKPGMDVEVAPSTIKREEHGYMLGKVTYVYDYPATAAGVMRHFQNDGLVTNLFQNGPVTQVHVALERDVKTPSGFRWSSSQGPDISVTSGTLCVGRVVTKSQTPASLVVPLLRAKAGLR